MTKDYFTGEVQCSECKNWFEPKDLYQHICENCWKKIERDIDKHLGKGD